MDEAERDRLFHEMFDTPAGKALLADALAQRRRLFSVVEIEARLARWAAGSAERVQAKRLRLPRAFIERYGLVNAVPAED